MTACESSGYTGAPFLSPIRHITLRFWRFLIVNLSKLINNSPFRSDVKMISSPCPQMLALAFFGGFDQTQKRPLLRPFSLRNLNLYFSSHRKASPGELLRFAGGWMSLNLKQNPGDNRGNPPLFSRFAQVQPAVKSLGFLYSL